MPIPNIFPNDNELERIRTLGKYEKLFENNQESVLQLHEKIKKQYKNAADLLYLSHAIPSHVSEFYGDFVQGDSERLTIDTVLDNAQEKQMVKEIVDENDLKEKIYDYAVKQSEYGFTVLLGRVEDGKFVIEEVEQDQYFPQADGSVIFATYLRDPHGDQPMRQRDLYLYTQHYQLVGNTVHIERRAWRTDTSQRASDAISLAYLGITAPEDEMIQNMTMLPIVQIDNGRKTRFGFGKSDYADIMPQLAEVNERSTHVATQLLKNLDAKLEMQDIPSLRSDDGSLKTFDYIMLPDSTSVKTRYVTNENPLLEETFKHIDRQFQFISWVSSVPMFELLKTTRPERVESLRIHLFSAIRKTNTKRSRVVKGIRQIIQIGFEMLNKTLTGTIDVQFSTVIPHDPLIEVQVEQIKVASGLSSRESAMRRLENYSQEEAEAELERIKNEDREVGFTTNSAPPQI
ncbi:MAG TPA: hypothetical protein VFM02_03610 [Candidatus Paceibacterota bacterium]|nr:hypothetical protein [Candidatus Paceibacterota bacterium]